MTADEAPPEFGWRRGGYVFYSFFFEDTLRIPITVTGLTGYDTANAGMVGTPRLYVPRPPLTDAEDLAHIVPLHDLRIGPGEDGMRAIVMVWRLRGPCARVAGSTTTGWTGEQIDGIHLRYTVLGGLFSETQWVPMQLSETLDGTPGYLFGVRSPRRSDCPAGYPPPRTS